MGPMPSFFKIYASLRSARAIAVACLLLTSLAAHAQDAHGWATRIDARYNSMQTLEASFTEVYSGGGVRRVESGVLLLAKPGRMRWDYVRPQRKLFVTDGRMAWFYTPEQKQARRRKLRSLDDLRTPLAYLLGRAKLEKEFPGLAIASEARPTAGGAVVLRGKPARMRDRIDSVEIEATASGEIVRLTARELDGSTTEFRFANQKLKAPAAAERFQFAPPPGVEDLNESSTQP